MSSAEPRTNAAIMSDLLSHVVGAEWSGQVNTSCHCHPEYASACPTCEARQYPNKGDNETHDPGCALAALIEETRAFLRAENDVCEARGEDTVYIP